MTPTHTALQASVTSDEGQPQPETTSTQWFPSFPHPSTKHRNTKIQREQRDANESQDLVGCPVIPLGSEDGVIWKPIGAFCSGR